ncbi:hypothetical protein GCM10010233_64510 [Streptomyces pseudogriseolus]|nr:hypothetical protein GCM10010233_64510 [Streptomyces gancidicus]
MSRQYYQRGHLVEAEQLDDIIAVKFSFDFHALGAEAAEVAALGSSAREQVREAGVDDETSDAFARANWVFVRPNQATREAFSTREEIPGTEATGNVIRRPNGRIGIATDALTVQLRPRFSEEEARRELESVGLTIVNKLRFAENLYEVRTTASHDALAASVDLHNNDHFLFAEPSLIEHIPARFRPTGVRYAQQWQWRNAGAGGGTPDADVRIEPAWDRTFGAGMRVAVIDNGFDTEHPDLAPGLDPLSGFFDDTAGTVFVQGASGMPDNNHGTFCAGMVGARHNNSAGGTGAAPECSLMLLACLKDQVGSQTTLARAVAYAAVPSMEVPGIAPDGGADILVSSLGPNTADWDLTSALDLALEFAATHGRQGKGLAIFWAASNAKNADVTKDEVVSHPDVIAVVRSNNQDREDNAARGPEVELIAPGVNVFSTKSGGGYGTSTGTSFAAPCAAGCAALALSVNPHLKRDQLREVMHKSADKIGGSAVQYDAAGHNDDYGFGRVNASRAVALATR